MTALFLACCASALSAGAAKRATALFQEAENLSRKNQKTEAMAKADEAIKELDRAHAANEKIEWQGMNGVRWAAGLARNDFLDYEKSFFFCRKLLEYSDSDYWNVPAHLEMALTYRAMKDFKKAQAQYDTIANIDERYRPSMLLPRAEMVYFDMRDRERGRALLEAALQNEAINGRERFGVLRDCAQRAMEKGDREEALQWYTMLEKIPFKKADERARFLTQTWYAMGKIEESLGRTAQAKEHYRKATELKDGEMRFRARARDALESIEYFE